MENNTSRAERTHPEDDLQKEIIKWFDKQFPTLSLMLHHSPFSGKRNKVDACKFSKLGTRLGVADIELKSPRAGWTGLAIYLRCGRNNPSEDQKDMIAEYLENGWKVITGKDFEGVQQDIILYAKSSLSSMLYNMPNNH